MEEDKISKQFMRTDLFTVFGNFFVSTCYRRSSAVLATDSWYYETFAWELDDKNQRTNIVADNSGAYSEKRALEQHFEVCNQLSMLGRFKDN